jgi:tetratricopeptide (TPR) repeat protein
MRNTIRTLAASVHELAEIQRENGDRSCVGTYREALDIAKTLGDTALCAVCAFNLGTTYLDIPDLRDLDEAERWYRESLDLYAPGDMLGRAKSIGQMGRIALDRFLEAREAKRPIEELARHLGEAARLYEQSLEMLPGTDITTRGTVHNQLGIIYRNAGDADRALRHYQEAIRCRELRNDFFSAGHTRHNVALALLNAGRPHDALAYAEAALANFLSFGERAAAEIQKTEGLIAGIKEAHAKERGNT